MDLDLDTIMKLIAPVITWATWVTRSIYKSKRDVDAAFFLIRGSKRDHSIKGKVKRTFYKIRSKK